MSDIGDMDAALLALDSYNNGSYFKTTTGDAHGIGGYVRVNNRNYENLDGFYAGEYVRGNTIVISYRGTDVNETDQNPDGSENFHKDRLYGYPLGAGLDCAQAQDALQYYNDVKGSDLAKGKDIEVVGQSLGGGLAGYVSMLTGARAYLFEPMPFVQAAEATGNVVQSTISTYAVDGEFLSLLRDGTFGRYVGTLTPDSRMAILAAARVVDGDNLSGADMDSPLFMRDDAEIGTTYLINPTSIQGVDRNADVVTQMGEAYFGGIAIHSQAIMTLDMFWYGHGTPSIWSKASPSVMDWLMNDALAEDVGVTTEMGAGTLSDQMMTMVAYSTSSNGDLPFGDTAASSLLSDMLVMGRVWDGLSATSFEKDVAGLVAESAELKAFNHVTDPNALNGILNTDGVQLSIDVGALNELSGGSAVPYLSFMRDFEQSMSSSDQSIDLGAILGGMTTFVVGMSPGASIHGVAGDGTELVVGTNTGSTITGSREYVQDGWYSGHYVFRNDILVGGSGDDTIVVYGGNNYLIGGGGSDTLYGGTGDDHIYGGDGDDRIYLGSGAFSSFGHDVIDGGAGTNTLVLGGSRSGPSYMTTGAHVIVSAASDGHSVQVDVAQESGSDGSDAKAVDIQEIDGSGSIDEFIGAGTGMRFVSGGGTTTFHLGAGDVGVGGTGTDIFYIGAGARVEPGPTNAYDPYNQVKSDEYHYVLSPDWKTVSSDSLASVGVGNVFLDTGTQSVELVNLPQVDYYHSTAVWTAENLGGGRYVVHDQSRGIDTLYGADGPETVTAVEDSNHTRIFGTRYDSPALDDVGQTVDRMGIGDGITSMPSIVASALRGFDSGGAYADLYPQLLTGSSLVRTGSSYGYGDVCTTGPTTMAVIAGHVDANGLTVGPGDPAVPTMLTIDQRTSQAGIAAFGATGYVAANSNGSYDLSHSSESILTGSGNDVVVTGTGDGMETVSTGAGNDLIVGRGTNQTIDAGTGDDMIAPGTGVSIINGGQGRDTVSYRDLTTGIAVSMHGAEGSVAKVGVSDVLHSVETVIGTKAGHDSFTGGGAGCMFVGGYDGNDFHLSGVATAMAGSGGNTFDIAPGSSVLLMGVARGDSISVGGVPIDGSRESAAYVKATYDDGSFTISEHLSISSSVGDFQTDVERYHWDATAGSGSDPDLTDPVVTGDHVGLLSGQDLSEVVVDIGGVDTRIFLAGYRDGMAGLHFVETARSVYSSGPYLQIYGGEHVPFDYSSPYPGQGLHSLDLGPGGVDSGVMHMFGFA